MDQIPDNLIAYALAFVVYALVYALLCGGFGYYVAEAKHRQWYEGVAFGLLLGPLGVIALACLPTLEARSAPKPARDRLRVSRDEDDDEKMRRFTDRERTKGGTPMDGAKPTGR